MTSRSIPRALLFVALAAALPVHAQSLSPAWTEYRERTQSDAPTMAPTDTRNTDAAPATVAPAQQAYAPATSAPVALASESAYPAPHADGARGAFFVAAQAGQAWIVDDVRQNTRAISAGYRWQAGPVVQVGIEGVYGRIDDKAFSEAGRPYRTGEADYASLGANARFQFGRSPLFAMTRVGYWRADTDTGFGSEIVDGAYAGVGLGVDFNRQLNLTLAYTYHAYASSYVYRNWNSAVYGTTINRADLVTLGLEARF